MLKHLDDGVGSVVTKLKTEGLFEDTLIFFLTDNGGAKGMSANNAPLRGFKGSLYEGGIRTPFIVSWPARFAGGATIDTPVISLDILPTVLDAVDARDSSRSFDGKSLLPLLTSKTATHHDILFWSEGGSSGEWAVRQGPWKLHVMQDQRQLVNLEEDPGEQVDLSKKYPQRVDGLRDAYDQWLEPMALPITGGGKRWGEAVAGNLKKRDKDRQRKRPDRQRKRKARRKGQ